MDPKPANLATEETETIVGPELPDHLIAKLRISIPGYELLDKIDSGGQATVYRAREVTSGLTVAIKVLNGGPNADAGARDRLLREAAALRALNHPNIVCAIEAGRTPLGLDFIVMNYVDGRPLDALWTDRKFSAAIAPEPPARLRLFKRICDIVQSAHLKGITHRDLSPSNILITADGEPHILDFGLASTAFDHLLSPAGRNITVTGQFIGKVKYASPEQARGERDTIDIRTDVYALGVILYQILTDGAFPYEVVGALVDVLNHIIHTQPLPPSSKLGDQASSRRHRQKDPRLVNETIEAVVLKALEKNPADRYQSAGALAADIHQYLDGRPTAAVARGRTVPGVRRTWGHRHLVTAIVTITIVTGILMNIRTILAWAGLSAATVAMGANPPVPSVPPKPAVHAAPAVPAPRLQPRIGAAPKPEFQTAGHTYKIDANQPGVTAVRSMPPKSFEPAIRNRSVKAFYREQLAKDAVSRDKLEKLNVGPFRHEFVWWAWHHWGLRDRAWWAWNNYAYFDATLWQEWMLDQDFRQLIAQFDAAHKARIPGFIPDAYAAEGAEVIYNDDYIEAVYNPTPTPPSIVVDSTAGVQLSNLLEGTPRLFGKKSLPIGTLNDQVNRYQFISLPADFDPTYQIEVKRDGNLYVFGPSITPKNEAFGEDAPKWAAVSNLVSGQGIQIVYQRQVKAGEKIHLHGVEWSVASEQIELFSPASPEALAASRHMVRDLEQMTNNKGDFVQANPSLNDYVQEARDVAGQLITANNNVNDDAVADCHYELNHLQKMSEAALDQTSDSHLAASGRDFVGRIKSLQESLNEVDEQRDPGATAQPDQRVIVKFSDGETDLSDFTEGNKLFTDKKYTPSAFPLELTGLAFTRREYQNESDLSLSAPSGSTIYLLIGSGANAAKSRTVVEALGWNKIGEINPVNDKKDVPLAVYRQTFTKSMDLTIPGSGGAHRILVAAKNLELGTNAGSSGQAPTTTPPSVPASGQDPAETLQFIGHKTPVTQVQFMPDGHSAISTGDDGTICIWDLKTGAELRRFSGSNKEIVHLSLATNANRMVTSGRDFTARVWDLESAKMLHEFKFNANTLAAISPDGQRVVVSSNQSGPHLCSASTGKAIDGYKSEGNYAADWSRDGKLFANGGWNHIVHVHDTMTLEELFQLRQPDQVYLIAFSPDGHRLLAGGPTGTPLCLWDLDKRSEISHFEAGTGRIHAAVFTPDGRYALIASDDADLIMMDLATTAVVQRFKGHTSGILGVAVSTDGKLALTAGKDGTARVWRLPAIADPAVRRPGLFGEYFGTDNFKQPIGNRIDPAIDFAWAHGEPPIAGCPTPKYSIRWTGRITVPAGGVSAIGEDVDDGFRLYIDGIEVAAAHHPASVMSKAPVAAGQHVIVSEYWNVLDKAHVKLEWIPTGGEMQLVPSSALSHDIAAEPK